MSDHKQGGGGPPRGPNSFGRGRGGQGNNSRGGQQNYNGGAPRAGHGGGYRGANRGSFAHRPGSRDTGPGPGIFLETPPNGLKPTYDSIITDLENKIVQDTAGREFELKLGIDDTGGFKFPGRRGYGSDGRGIVLRTNYLDISVLENVELVQYAVSITQHSKQVSKSFRKSAIVQLMQRHDLFSPGIAVATDYGSTFITNVAINGIDSVNPKWIKTSIDRRDPGAIGEPQPRHLYTAEIRLVRTLSLQDMLNCLKSPSPNMTYAWQPDLVQAMNIVIGKAPYATANTVAVSGGRYFPYGNNSLTARADLGHALEALRGYCSSTRPVIGRTLLNVNVCTSAFYKALPLKQLLDEYSGTPAKENVFVRGLRIVVRHKNKKGSVELTRTINRISDQDARKTTFEYEDKVTKSKSMISVYTYYQKAHNLTLASPQLRLVGTGRATSPEWFPMELCSVVPGQPFRKFLHPTAIDPMLKFASRRPNQNAHSIAGTGNSGGEGIQVLCLRDAQGGLQSQADGVGRFGFRVQTSLLTVPGRILNQPSVTYAGQYTTHTKEASWNMMNTKFIDGAKAFNISVIRVHVPHPKEEMPDTKAAVGKLLPALRKTGMNVNGLLATVDVHLESLESLEDKTRARNLGELHKVFKTITSASAVLVILTYKDKWLYSRIKYLADTVYGVHTICCIGSKLVQEKGQGGFFGNLALKFNIKGGGNNHLVKDLWAPPLDKNTTMLVGIDVTHPSPGSAEKAPSIATVVASVDGKLTQWPGSCGLRDPRVEIEGSNAGRVVRSPFATGLATMIRERLQLWKEYNKGNLPKQIIVYRDGVSEGQYNEVLNSEWTQFEEAFKEEYKTAKWPTVTILIVGKRHHTRFYPTHAADASDPKWNGNPLPGTIVDRGIVHRILSEFWLQAHHGLSGTARPAHYVIVKDENNFTADQIQNFTHRLCFSFGRATKAISVCPPAYYADLLATRARLYMYSVLHENNGGKEYVAEDHWKGKIHPNLENTTFYI